MHDTGSGNFLRQIDSRWIQPELARRREEGRLTDTFSVRQCLIKLPRGRDPLVEFNEEINWQANAIIPPHFELKEGDLFQWHHIEKFEAAKPPTVNGQVVPFVYMWHQGFGTYQIVFDFFGESVPPGVAWPYGKVVADSLQTILEERIVKIAEPHEDKLSKLGLWAARRIVPYPLGAIVAHVAAGDDAAAIATLERYFTTDRIAGIVESWRSNPIFAAVWPAFEAAITAFRADNTVAAIYTLVPQVEGVISAWLYEITPDDVPYRTESKAKKFIEMLSTAGPRMYATERMIKSLGDFLLEGPVQSKFRTWLQDIDTSFPNRHAVSHGRFDAALFSPVNLVKLVLILDSICDLTLPHLAVAERDAG